MVNVSKRKLKPKFAKSLFIQLAGMLNRRDKNSTAAVLDDLLTDAEQLMLAKRLAAILMLHGGCSSYRVWTTLNMSSSTVRDIRTEYEAGAYDDIVKYVARSKKDREAFWKTLEVVLRGGMPSMGKDRWQWLDKM